MVSVAEVLQLHASHGGLDERFLGLATSAYAKGRQWQRALQLAMETGPQGSWGYLGMERDGKRLGKRLGKI